MPPSFDEFRELLVERWCILSSDRWRRLTSRYSDPAQLVDLLRRTERFSSISAEPRLCAG